MNKLLIVFFIIISMFGCKRIVIEIQPSFNLPTEFNNSNWTESQASEIKGIISFNNDVIIFNTTFKEFPDQKNNPYAIFYPSEQGDNFTCYFNKLSYNKYSIVYNSINVVEIEMLTNSDILVTYKGTTKPYHR